MNDNDYKEALFYAASIFNERLGAEFSEDNLVLRCFQTENQQEVFEHVLAVMSDELMPECDVPKK